MPNDVQIAISNIIYTTKMSVINMKYRFSKKLKKNIN
jgi:hypothetical protein